MKKFTTASLLSLCLISVNISANSPASNNHFTCDDLTGQWVAATQDHPYKMNIYPDGSHSDEVTGKVFWVEYNVSPSGNRNRLFCYEGTKGVKPITIAFERVYGGHSIATFNDELQLLWAGVLAKQEGKHIPRMDHYWFKKVLP